MRSVQITQFLRDPHTPTDFLKTQICWIRLTFRPIDIQGQALNITEFERFESFERFERHYKR